MVPPWRLLPLAANQTWEDKANVSPSGLEIRRCAVSYLFHCRASLLPSACASTTLLLKLMMQKIPLLLVGCLLMVGAARSAQSPINYARVHKADVSRMQGHWVRYVEASDYPCFTIQLFTTERLDTLTRQKTICSVGKLKFYSDFAHVGIEKVEFNSDHLRLEIDFTNLRAPGRNVRECSIPIRNGIIGDLAC